MGMTRSDNPFGDLPEWKERQRLQEAQGHGGGHAGGDYQPQEHGYAPQAAPHQQPHAEPAVGDPQGYENGGQQFANPSSGSYQEPAPAASHLHYNVHQDGSHQGGQPVHLDAPQEYHQPHHQVPMPERGYDPQTQVTYPASPNGQYPAHYQDQSRAPQNYDARPVEAGTGQPGLDGPGLRQSHYDDRGEFAAQPDGFAQTGAAPGYDFNTYAPGQQTGAPDGNATYHEPGAPQPGHWDNAQMGGGAVVPAHANLELGEQYDEDDDEYYDDDEGDEQRYSWKLLAAIVVTGAVVTGGGIVLYDSFASGGKSGDAPIIRANQNPAKTAPANAGGRKFAHQDSKLLGRLDTTAGTKKSASIGAEADNGNRVRSVPTVKIGRDGRLILPKAPQPVTTLVAPASQTDNRVATVGGQRIAPGINVVNTLNGSARSGLGGTLPPVQPKAVVAASQPRQPAVLTRPVVPKIRALNATKPGTQAPPVASNRSSGNLATARRSGPPPVPSKSSVGSAWRMTSAGAAAKEQPKLGGVEPTIARAVQPILRPSAARSVAAPVTNAVPRTNARATTQGGGGYVAVLATAPTRMRALQSFAELQQKHPAALQGRVPNVQKADLSARGLGIMYRVVVGPASSRGAAGSVCSSLKSAGYTGCWVKSN